MSARVWLAARTLDVPELGGHMWQYLNWALGLRSLGCEVTWLEAADPATPSEQIRSLADQLKTRLEPYGLADRIALCSGSNDPLPKGATDGCLDISAATEADLLLNFSAHVPRRWLDGFRRTAMLDTDPGLTQIWVSEGVIDMPAHDVFFTIGETVGRKGDGLPDTGNAWVHTPPCVALDVWPRSSAPSDAPFTTVSSWDNPEWVTDGHESYDNNKRSGFLPFLDLPSRTGEQLELALCLAADEDLRLTPDQEAEKASLEQRGWRVVHSYTISATPSDYASYIGNSRGEFSCAKPSFVRLQNAWVSDRTLCYLASGKPAVVQHTGPSRLLPDGAGMFRFKTLEQARASLEAVAADYERQCQLARALAEEHFDARRITAAVLERAL
jgi:hypothetical protein